MEELSADAHQRRETFARYGLAMYNAQCVEKSLAILVSSVFNTDFLPANQARREELHDEAFSKTIGPLVMRLQKQVRLPTNLYSTLEEAREKRNWLAHEYFWIRAGELLTLHGRAKMIDELTELSEWFSKLDVHLASIYESWAEKIGIPQEKIDEGVKKLIKRNRV